MPLHQNELQQRYEDCVEQCADSLFRVAYRLTGNQTLAGELVQETYLNAWKSLASLEDPKKMRAWMFAIMRNQYTKLLRAETKISTTSTELDQLSPPSHSHAPNNQTSEAIQQAIESLDNKFQMPLLLVSMEGLSVDEAATILETPRGTVLSRLHRGRQKLKEILMRMKDDSASRKGASK